jgi:hypothetical protein
MHNRIIMENLLANVQFEDQEENGKAQLSWISGYLLRIGGVYNYKPAPVAARSEE